MEQNPILPMSSSTQAHTSQFEMQEAVSRKSRGITRLTVEIPTFSMSKTLDEPRPAARWMTLEFKAYYVFAVFVIPTMIWIPISISQPSHPNYPFYRSKLSPGWLFNRPVDNSDAQYRSFRSNIFALSLLAAAQILLKLIYTFANTHRSPDSLYLIPFHVTFSVLMLLGLHGSSIIKIFAFLSINYLIAKTCRNSRFGPALIWIFNGGMLFANEHYSGYKFGSIYPALEFLDRFQGVYPRWYISFNITMLRMVSFSMDCYWASNAKSVHDTDESQNGPSLSEKMRKSSAHPIELYSYINYVAYALYPPLYIAGPIITFNDFVWQLRRPLTISTRSFLGYLFRFLVCLLTMEFILHFMYMVAIKDRKAWQGDTPAQLSMIGFWNLIIVWLKLLLPWRFFRLWSLKDGIDPPENMVRCMVNNYSAFGFWRSWHRSYNLWVIRYIYVPLGGSKRVVVNTLFVFTFVALWHDLSFRLLAWGWLISLFVLPELIAGYVLPQAKYGSRIWYRHLCGVGAIFNMMMMMAANLVGFVLGTEGTQFLIHELFFTWKGIGFMFAASTVIFVGVQLMFEYREEEMRRGVYRRC